ncbi:MAG: hypothetical protein IKZ08_02420 [Bacteroidales bacterium]|nr:hypothetical protein [Bacteroidales bacterium]
MFVKTYEVVISTKDTAAFANLLSNLRIWFHMGDECAYYSDLDRRWVRPVKIVTTKAKLMKLCASTDMIICHKFVD